MLELGVKYNEQIEGTCNILKEAEEASEFQIQSILPCIDDGYYNLSMESHATLTRHGQIYGKK